MQFETVTDGLVFPEGPVAMRDGSVLIVDSGAGTLLRVEPGGRQEVLAETGGAPNGVAIGPDGAAYLCNNGGGLHISRVDSRLRMRPAPERYVGGSIQRVDLATGKVVTLYDSCDGKPLLAPNDLVFDRSGSFWFTDSGRDEGDNYHKGLLLYARADGSSIVCARRRLWYPNGVGLSPDGGTIYWASTYTGRLYGEAMHEDGTLEKPSGWSQGTILHNAGGEELLDSLAVEADGRVCVARVHGGIRVVAATGEWEDIVIDDGLITNICFGGEDMRDAWITAAASGRLLKCRWPRPGLKLGFEA